MLSTIEKINEIKLLHNWQGSWSIEINGRIFMVCKDVIRYTRKYCTPIYEYFVTIAPEYNQSGKFKVCARKPEQIVEKLEKLNFRIV